MGKAKSISAKTSSERQKKKKAAKVPLLKRLRSVRWSRYLRRVVYIIIAIIAAPLLLTILYRFDGVKPVSTLMIADVVTFQSFKREWRDIEEISPFLVQSVLVSEDGQFCAHYGVDLGELKAVVEAVLDGETTRGASTISMQIAKNLFLWGGRSYVRKAMEIPLAIWIDFVIPKDRLMEIYLNIAEWGDGIYGIGAAAPHHFNRQADNLTRRQAALLAVTLPNPYLRDPAKPSSRMSHVANVVERRARQSGAYIGCVSS
ncbi:MAG: monofunctional biosynthetic peptidoglycan transglycosylase [Pseudomonadota bacterium]